MKMLGILTFLITLNVSWEKIDGAHNELFSHVDTFFSPPSHPPAMDNEYVIGCF